MSSNVGIAAALLFICGVASAIHVTSPLTDGSVETAWPDIDDLETTLISEEEEEVNLKGSEPTEAPAPVDVEALNEAAAKKEHCDKVDDAEGQVKVEQATYGTPAPTLPARESADEMLTKVCEAHNIAAAATGTDSDSVVTRLSAKTMLKECMKSYATAQQACELLAPAGSSGPAPACDHGLNDVDAIPAADSNKDLADSGCNSDWETAQTRCQSLKTGANAAPASGTGIVDFQEKYEKDKQNSESNLSILYAPVLTPVHLQCL